VALPDASRNKPETLTSAFLDIHAQTVGEILHIRIAGQVISATP
jgi:hypothetical protein